MSIFGPSPEYLQKMKEKQDLKKEAFRRKYEKENQTMKAKEDKLIELDDDDL